MHPDEEGGPGGHDGPASTTVAVVAVCVVDIDCLAFQRTRAGGGITREESGLGHLEFFLSFFGSWDQENAVYWSSGHIVPRGVTAGGSLHLIQLLGMLSWISTASNVHVLEREVESGHGHVDVISSL